LVDPFRRRDSRRVPHHAETEAPELQFGVQGEGGKPLPNGRSVDFEATAPLFELPPRASAAYLGTYLMALLEGLVTQSRVGLFLDVVTRAHTLTMLDQDVYWSDVVEAHLDGAQRETLREVLALLVELSGMLNLDDEQVTRFRARV